MSGRIGDQIERGDVMCMYLPYGIRNWIFNWRLSDGWENVGCCGIVIL